MKLKLMKVADGLLAFESDRLHELNRLSVEQWQEVMAEEAHNRRELNRLAEEKAEALKHGPWASKEQLRWAKGWARVEARRTAKALAFQAAVSAFEGGQWASFGVRCAADVVVEQEETDEVRRDELQCIAADVLAWDERADKPVEAFCRPGIFEGSAL